jgi:hypothetical protein
MKMDRLKTQLLAASGLMILVLAMTLINSGSAGAFQTNDVRVINTKSEPVPTDDLSDAKRELLQAAKYYIQHTGTNINIVDVVSVPVGKRFVIEHITMEGKVPPNQVVSGFEILCNGFWHDLLVNEQPHAGNGDAIFRASQLVRLYADSGTLVRATFVRSSALEKGAFNVVVSGYLVDMP